MKMRVYNETTYSIDKINKTVNSVFSDMVKWLKVIVKFI